jgi:hypothetical protein
MNAKLAAYQQMAGLGNSKALSEQALMSIELYVDDMLNPVLPPEKRAEAGIAAITLAQALSDNVRPELPQDEQILLIKIFGQLIKNINKCARGEITDLSKEKAAIRLLRKLLA